MISIFSDFLPLVNALKIQFIFVKVIQNCCPNVSKTMLIGPSYFSMECVIFHKKYTCCVKPKPKLHGGVCGFNNWSQSIQLRFQGNRTTQDYTGMWSSSINGHNLEIAKWTNTFIESFWATRYWHLTPLLTYDAIKCVYNALLIRC